MKKILVILVGGTICTAVNESGTLSVSETAGIQLKKNYLASNSVYRGDVELKLSDNMFILSENMTIDKWNLMLQTYRKWINAEKFDGVIFAHGTDSLAYSAALFSIILANTDIPVFFVSSNERLDSPRTNGNANFRYAVECICMGISPNIYVTYKNMSDNQMYLHLASRIEQCKNYSDDFYSNGAIDITDLSEQNSKMFFDKLNAEFPTDKRNALIDINGEWTLSNCVLMITPYVGLNYDAYDYSRFSAILHGSYHSGTACVEKCRECTKYGNNSILHMIDLCIDNKIDTDIYIAPSKISGEVYETVPTIGKHRMSEKKVNFMYGTTNEMAYAKILLAYSLFRDKEEIHKFLQTEINFEKIYE